MKRERTYYFVAWREPRNYSTVYRHREQAEERVTREGAGVVLPVRGANVSEAIARSGVVHRGWLDSLEGS